MDEKTHQSQFYLGGIPTRQKDGKNGRTPAYDDT